MDEMKKVKRAFQAHKQNAKQRNIDFKLTFDEWWEVWKPHFHNRGRGKGQYVMYRTMDKGGYEIGNVYIGTVERNALTRKYVTFDKKMDIVKSNNVRTIDEGYKEILTDDFTDNWVPKHLQGFARGSVFD